MFAGPEDTACVTAVRPWKNKSYLFAIENSYIYCIKLYLLTFMLIICLQRISYILVNRITPQMHLAFTPAKT